MTLGTITVATQPRKIRPYQHQGINWLRDGKRRVLTDQFGLGKTTQAIFAAEGPTLVAAPVHLLNHWRREIKACKPDALVRVADANGLAARKVQLLAGDGAWPGGLDIADFYVCNIELLRTGMSQWFTPLREGLIQTFIVDEAHRLRGRNAQQTRGAWNIAHSLPRVYLLTATPQMNQPNDLYSLLHMLDPVRFSSYYKFCEQYLVVLQTPWGPKILGLRRGRELLNVWREYALGRKADEVALQLPELQESVLEVTPPPDFYTKYTRAKTELRLAYDGTPVAQQGILQRLRGLTQQPKLQAVCALIEDAGCHEDTVIYTYHRDLAYAVGQLLNVPVITGNMPPKEREHVAAGTDFLVATFPSVAEGISLAHMHNVIWMEHDWQPGLMEQALHRVHRPGNTASHTNVWHIVVKKTVDVYLYNTAHKRGQTMEQVVEAALRPLDGEDDEQEGDNAYS